MLLVLPLRVEGPPEAPGEGPPPRATPVAWALFGLLIALFALENLVLADQAFAWGWLPDAALRITSFVSASWKLYPDPELFRPWQLWTHALLHEPIVHHGAGWWLGIWHIAGNLLFLAVFARAIERWLGSAMLVLGILLLTPAAALIHLRDPCSQVPLLGASGLVSGIMGMAWALFPRHRVRCALGYFAVIIVGFIPFRIDLRWLALVFVLQDATRHWLSPDSGVAYEVHLAGMLAGFLLGHASRLLRGRGLLPAT